MLVLSGAYPDKLAPYTWWFPIVGRVPYKGFFDFGAARAAEHDLVGERLRRLPATVAGVQHARLVQRSVAVHVTARRHDRPGEHGHSRVDAQHVLRARVRPCSTSRSPTSSGPEARRGSFDRAAIPRRPTKRTRNGPTTSCWRNSGRCCTRASIRPFGRTRRTRSRASRLATRVYAKARHDLVTTLGPQLRTIPATALSRVRLDNAALLAHRIYNTNLDLFDRVWVAGERRPPPRDPANHRSGEESAGRSVRSDSFVARFGGDQRADEMIIALLKNNKQFLRSCPLFQFDLFVSVYISLMPEWRESLTRRSGINNWYTDTNRSTDTNGDDKHGVVGAPLGHE